MGFIVKNYTFNTSEFETVISQEVYDEVSKAVMEMVTIQELDRIKKKYKPLYEAREQLVGQEIADYLEFLMDYQCKSDSDSEYFDIQALDSDMGELMYYACETDQLTYTMVMKNE